MIMAKFPYLLVLADNPATGSATYKVLQSSLTADLSGSCEVQALLDDATPKACNLLDLDSSRGLLLEVYTLIEPISGFLYQSLAKIEEQLGDINDNFFKTKALHRPPELSISWLEDRDGKIIVRIKVFAKKRVHSITEEPAFSRLKRTKLATIAPSTTAQPSEYESNQLTPSQKILDDRPMPDADIPPISLLYDGFGRFLDIFHSSTDVMDLSEVDTAELQRVIDIFAQKMCLFYDSDDLRRDEALPILNRIFSARSGVDISTLSAATVGSISTDSHDVWKHRGAAVVAEFKNQAANNTAIAEVKMVGYVAHSHVKGMKEEREQELFERWRMPCLGLTVTGADVTFYAIVAVDYQYRVVSLTPTLSCIPSASEGRTRKALYKAFAAASVLQAQILDDTEKFLVTLPPKIPASARRFPNVTKLRKFGSSSEYITFQILRFHPDRQSYRLLYIADTAGPEKQTIVIKFSQQYSIELHEFCAERGHAPPILAFETLPGRWQAIAMKHIDPCYPIVNSPGLEIHRERWTNELLTLVDAFHKRGFVHGDLRDANIICDDKGTAWLIDFDWGGIDGHSFYPTPNLNDELLEGRSRGDWKITKDDDKRVLKRTLEKF